MILILLGVIQLIQASSENNQKPVNLSKFAKVFEHYNQSNQFSKSLFTQLKSKVLNGATIQDLDDHFAELVGHLEKDEFSQQQLYQVEQARLEGTILQLEDELKQLEEQNAYLIQKQETLNEEAQQIDVLFSANHEAYIQKIGEQYTLIEAIDELISQVQEKQTIKDDSDIMEKLKQISEDQHISILAQVTAHLDMEQADKILVLFQDLKDTLKEGLEVDEQNNELNVKLHTEIRQSIGRYDLRINYFSMIPETLIQQEEILNSIKEQQNTLSITKMALEKLKSDMDEVTSDRNFALLQIQQAKSILKDNIQDLSDPK
ncbi:unnamed protein product (macronuclear) [Paramecium tetraurelia]|uniref:Uncharacterized protein n=1 Tax=Paramecium tetraurelia TaxID=5888 RepID=A0CKM3_PARTE|nr:uncharacterized protein GSPATT00001054001 [Paramecium tetraurelia]CAK71340.1 unnamed protein product [Paramecium tetraurelia]|eukprot:XP_001438737.1 hypothetical protein (macronuclear) [Paramecium tetraurelia strain d4-2]